MTHLMSILILLLKIYATKSCAGEFSSLVYASKTSSQKQSRIALTCLLSFTMQILLYSSYDRSISRIVVKSHFRLGLREECSYEFDFDWVGISLKTQELYALVFLTRYLDQFTDYVSLYNSVMKVVFIASSLAIVWCMRRHPLVRKSYDMDLDTFRHQYVLFACFVLALLLHEIFTFQEVFSHKFL